MKIYTIQDEETDKYFRPAAEGGNSSWLKNPVWFTADKNRAESLAKMCREGDNWKRWGWNAKPRAKVVLFEAARAA